MIISGPLQHQQVVRAVSQQQVVQAVAQQVVVSSPSMAPIPARHVLVHNVGGNRKSVVISQEQVKKIFLSVVMLQCFSILMFFDSSFSI